MPSEIKKWQFRCACCNTTAFVEGPYAELPKGWRYVKVGPCGLTNYYRDEERCPKCVKK